jgi:glutamate/tyrosine decarboxylase-like PLP-dependent enzyme
MSAGPALYNTRLELSRNIKNLKIWMSFKENGIDKYMDMIRKNLWQAQYLAGRIQFYHDLELMAPVETNVVAFRFNPQKEGIDLNNLNKEILMNLQEDGKAVVSSTVLNGKYCLRAAITNHRSLRCDFDLLVTEVMYWGNKISNTKKIVYEPENKNIREVS